MGDKQHAAAAHAGFVLKPLYARPRTTEGRPAVTLSGWRVESPPSSLAPEELFCLTNELSGRIMYPRIFRVLGTLRTRSDWSSTTGFVAVTCFNVTAIRPLDHANTSVCLFEDDERADRHRSLRKPNPRGHAGGA